MIRLATILLGITAVRAAVSPTAQLNTNRTGSTDDELALTPAKLVAGKFGKLGTYSIAGNTFAQPLYAPAITVSGVVRNLVLAATESNNVYAFDADRPNSAALWSVNLATGYTGSMGIGFLGALGAHPTMTADIAANALYVEYMTSTPTHVIARLNLATGATVWSTTVSGTFGVATFDPTIQTSRTGLTLANSRVYVGFSSLFETGESYHGWVFAYNATTGARGAVFCASPNSLGAGIWQSGGGIPVEDNGDLLVVTGNGEFLPSNASYGQSVLRLDQDLNIVDYFTPSNYVATNAVDADLSSGKPILIPGTHKLVIAGKDFWVYVINTACMGHLQGSGFGGCTQQAFQTNSGGTITAFSGSFGSAFMNNVFYAPLVAGSIYAFAWNSSTQLFNTTPVIDVQTYGNPGPAQMSGTINGTSNGILWVVNTTGTSSAHSTIRAGTLRALNPATLAEYWNSDTSASTNDTLGNLAKYDSPLVPGNGKVYVATQSSVIDIYGLLSPANLDGVGSLSGGASIK